MITGVHSIIYSKNSEAVREFFRDVLGYPSVDAGRGWLIFKLPPMELAAHPADEGGEKHELYLMCDDLDATLKELESKSIERDGPIHEQPWGRATSIKIAEGTTLGLYQPKHPVAIDL